MNSNTMTRLSDVVGCGRAADRIESTRQFRPSASPASQSIISVVFTSLNHVVTVVVAAGVLGATVQLAAIYVIPDTRKVPVERLVANLERALAADPGNLETRINLARLHGMAYALKTDEVDAARGDSTKPEEPYYGLHPDLVPYKTRKAATPAEDSAAREHLKKATEHYAVALARDPRNLLARLGYAWTLEQAGEKRRAIEEYRQVIRDAWRTEETAQRLFPEDRFFTYEAAEYLIPLLDPERDAAEIAELRTRQKNLAERPARAITPVVIPLADDTPADAIAAPHARIAFDADGSGRRRRWTWISPAAGWLVHDPDGRGEITSALQWFGSVTFWLFWQNGFEALAALDDDGDGELAGDEMRHLAIWQDRNSDGVSNAGEVQPLAHHGVVALSCRYTDGDRVTFAAVSPRGVRLANGRTRPAYDVMLRPVGARVLTRRNDEGANIGDQMLPALPFHPAPK